MTLLFLHGAGGFEEDRVIADALVHDLGLASDLRYPHLPDEDMSAEAWSAPLRGPVSRLAPSDVVVGHSFGGSLLLKALVEGLSCAAPVVLLSIPDWGPDGWDVADYVVPAGDPGVDLTVLHCRDDDVVPVEHHDRYATAFPAAHTQVLESGGHQFVGGVPRIAATVRAAWARHAST